MIQNIKDLEKQLKRIPKPTYFFKIGDEVTIGNLKNVIISEIYFEGKGYLLDYTSIDNNYGRPITHNNQKMIVAWYEIRKKHNNTCSLIQNEDITINYTHRTLQDLLSKKYFFGLDMNPNYQRDYVWTQEDKLNLIDAIFNNIDIGKFIVNNTSRYGGDFPLYEIVDGKQRVNAICEFYEDRFSYKNFYFSDLSRKDMWHFTEYRIALAEIDNASEKDIMHIFLMVNSNGKIMSKRHLEKVRKIYESL